MIRVGTDDAFEFNYRAKLRAALQPHGLLVEYAEDRATLDIGLHLYARPVQPAPSLGETRVWFQAKGIRTAKLPADQFLRQDEVAVGQLPVDHVRFWHGFPEPVYLVVYIESADSFVAEDVRDVVDRTGGPEMLADAARREQKEMTLRIRSDAELEEVIEWMPRHRSMRIDGPAFRGRPLGHRYDPLRSEMKPLPADDFEALVTALLAAHEFRPAENVPLDATLDADVGRLVARRGTLHLTYEWVSPLFTEFGFEVDSEFRIEDVPEHAQGDVLVVIHSEPKNLPHRTSGAQELVARMHELAIDDALVFFNASELTDDSLFGAWRTTLDPLARVPQGLGSLSFNLLTTTLVYLDFADRIAWRHLDFL